MRIQLHFIILIMMLLSSITVTAGIVEDDEDAFWEGGKEPAHDDYGIAECWFSKDGVEWEQSTAHPTLKLGEPFYIKVRIKTYMENVGVMSISMSTLDNPLKDYELIEEPKYAENARFVNMSYTLVKLQIMHPEINETHEYIWKARVNPETDWGGGNSPINYDIQFGDHTFSPLTFANINILDEYWEGYDPVNPDDTGDGSTNINGNNNNTPGFETILLISALFAIIIIYKKRKR